MKLQLFLFKPEPNAFISIYREKRLCTFSCRLSLMFSVTTATQLAGKIKLDTKNLKQQNKTLASLRTWRF